MTSTSQELSIVLSIEMGYSPLDDLVIRADSVGFENDVKWKWAVNTSDNQFNISDR